MNLIFSHAHHDASPLLYLHEVYDACVGVCLRATTDLFTGTTFFLFFGCAVGGGRGVGHVALLSVSVRTMCVRVIDI